MKLASLASGRDGELIVVSRDLTRAVRVASIARTLQAALDDWAKVAPKLEAVSEALEAGRATDAFAFVARDCASPLPRAYHWADGSAYLNHVRLVRQARGAEMPERFSTDPLLYQGGSDDFLGPCDDIPLVDEAWGLDFEAEVAIVTDDVPVGVRASEAETQIRLVMLVNDVSLRGLIPGELEKGFGFYQSKPASAFSPVAVTPDELGHAWRGAMLHRPLCSFVNDELFGRPDAGLDMNFSFADLIAHAARTRNLRAGSIVGSGTVSNAQGTEHGSRIADGGVGYSCLAELRMIETIRDGAPRTPFLRKGDRVRIEMRDDDDALIFGAIEQRVVSQ